MKKVLAVFLLIFSISFNSHGEDLNSCFLQAAARYNIPPALLVAIAKVESGFRPWVININHNGKSLKVINPRSYQEAVYYLTYLHQNGYNYDVGIGQINVWNIKRLRIDPVYLLNPCNNIMVSAHILRENINKYGFTWDAIWRYNGRRDYAYKVYRALISMGFVAQKQ
ncbi:MAG: lytic transglycosylase domain-containing protein [Hydrogenothermaceae bacterium]